MYSNYINFNYCENRLCCKVIIVMNNTNNFIVCEYYYDNQTISTYFDLKFSYNKDILGNGEKPVVFNDVKTIFLKKGVKKDFAIILKKVFKAIINFGLDCKLQLYVKSIIDLINSHDIHNDYLLTKSDLSNSYLYKFLEEIRINERNYYVTHNLNNNKIEILPIIYDGEKTKSNFILHDAELKII